MQSFPATVYPDKGTTEYSLNCLRSENILAKTEKIVVVADHSRLALPAWQPLLPGRKDVPWS